MENKEYEIKRLGGLRAVLFLIAFIPGIIIISEIVEDILRIK